MKCVDSAVLQTLLLLCFLIGTWKLLLFICGVLRCTRRHCCRSNYNGKLQSYMGTDKQTYAVVTGGSDGIGLELCDQLAARGFHICMVARNQAKMDGKIAQLRLKYPSVQFKAVQADFSQMTRVADYEKLVDDELAAIDIGVVCLNAGAVTIGPYDLITDQQIESQMTVNMLHPIYLARALMPQLMQRDERSAMVVTSSGLSGMPMPSVASYSATKAAVSSFFTGLSYEVQDKVDVMVWDAGSTDTQFVANAPKSNFTASTKDVVAGCLRDLGKERVTSGILRHDFAHLGVPLFPLGMLGAKIADEQRDKFLTDQDSFKKSQ